jgi:hypothetical protein
MISLTTEAHVNCADSGAGAWFRPWRFAALLLILIIAAFPEAILGSHTFFFRDFGLFGYPVAHYYRNSFWQGELPHWNPLNNCGLPFLAQWNTMVLYPFSIFYLVFPLNLALGIFNLGHLFLGGIGMYLLAHYWTEHRLAASVAGLAYAFNGLTLHSLMWPNNVAALGWLPWVLWYGERAWREGGRALLASGFIGALQMLAGAPEIILLTWLGLGALWLSELGLGQQPRLLIGKRFLLLVVLVLGLTAVQLLPFADFLAHSQRAPDQINTGWAMPIWGWANLLVPLFRTYPSFHGVYAQYDQYWTSSYYAGIGVLALAVLSPWRARRAWLLWGLAILGLALALGPQGHLYTWLRTVFPQLAVMRFPIKFVVLTIFTLPMLAALALARNLDVNVAAGPKAARRPALLFLVLTCCIVVLLWAARRWPLPDDNWPATWQNGINRLLFLALIVSVLWLRLRRAGRQPVLQVLLDLALLLCIWLDLLTHVPRQNPTVSPGVYELGLVDSLLPANPRPKLGESRAMISPFAQNEFRFTFIADPTHEYPSRRTGLFANCNLLEAMPKVNGFFSLYPKHNYELINEVLYAQTNANLPRLADFMAVSYVTAPGKLFEWEPRSTWLPVLTAGQKPIFADDPQTLRALTSAAFEPLKVVYLPTESKPFITVTNPSSVRLTATQFTPHRLTFRVVAAEQAMVAIAQTYYHCWKVRVNGKPARLWRANLAFQALEVPAGTSEVELVYQDRAFWLGAVVSLVFLLGCVAKWALPTRRSQSEWRGMGDG